MSLRGTDVAATMTRVEDTLAAAEKSPEGARGVLPVAPEGDGEVNVAVLRKSADIRLDFPPGSARPVIGAAVRLGKRTLRRAVRWYVAPMMEQQGRFNHALLDSIERLRVRIERLPQAAGAGTLTAPYLPPFGLGRAVAVGSAAPALADLLGGDTENRIDALSGDAVDQLTSMSAGSVDLVVCDATGLEPAPVIAMLESARTALSFGGAIILSAAPDPASLQPPALEWALSATGFARPTRLNVGDLGSPSGDLADQLAQVDRMARSAGVVLVARRDP